MSDNKTSSLVDALHELQTAQQTLESAIKKLSEHNIDTQAHKDIRDLIDNLLDSDAIYTREQIDERIDTKLKIHSDTNFKTAHPGWKDYSDELEKRFDKIDSRIEYLEAWVRDDGNAGGSDLQKELQAIEDKYEPILNDLYASAQKQIELGNDEGLAAINKIISDTLEQKKQEIMAVMEKYQTGTGEPDVPDPSNHVTIHFNPNGGSGDMPDVTVVKGSKYMLPACLFQPPALEKGESQKVFSIWSSEADGSGTFTGIPGNTIDLSLLSGDGDLELTLYANWTVPEVKMR